VPLGAGRQSGYGNNWVSVCLIVHLPFLRRAVGLTILSRLWRLDPEAGKDTAAKRKLNPDYPTKPELARQMLDLIIARFPDRAIELVGDSAYATKVFAGVPARVSVTSRLKSNTQLYAPTPPRTGKRGQPAKKGHRLAKLKQIADDPQTVWEQPEVTRSGKRQTVLCHTFECLWYDVWGQRPVRVVVVKATRPWRGLRRRVDHDGHARKRCRDHRALRRTLGDRGLIRGRQANHRLARRATASRRRSSAPSRSAFFARQLRSPGTRCMAAPNTTSTTAANAPPGTCKSASRPTKTCSVCHER